MAVLQMERIHICAMKRDRKAILELVQRRGVIEVKDLPGDNEVFTKKDTSAARGIFSKNIDTAAQALEILDNYAPVKGPSLGFLRGRAPVGVEESDAFYSKREEIVKASQRIVHLDRTITEAKAEHSRIEALEEALVPWMDLPVAQTFSKTKKTSVFIGSLDGELSLDDILAQLAQAAPELDKLHVEIVSSGPAITSFFVIVLNSDAAMAEEALRSIGFTRPPSPSHRTPVQQKKRLEEKRAKAEETIQQATEEIKTFSDSREELKFLHDHMEMRHEKYSVIENLAQSKHVFFMDGYVPAPEAPKLQNELISKFTCDVSLASLADEEESPVLLKNNAVVEAMEPVLESYSLPGKGELDPSSAMSIFYFILFGLMFSDFFYGLILVVGCGTALLKFKNMEANWRKNLKLFFGCGLATMFWGVIFSSYFGDMFDAVARQFFGRAADAGPVIPPLWFAPLDDPMRLLMFSLLLGIIHLTAGYIMKIITCAKNKQYPDILYDAVFPVFVIYPLIIILMGSSMFEGIGGFRLNIPPMVSTVLLAVSGVCMLGVTLTGGRESKNWVKRLLKGIYALYNVLAGWLGDILSYSRLLALGLATGVIGTVVNQLGGMVGGGVIGLIVFILIFALGHSLNFGINVLGAYVHSNRLEYVEFFGKFYEGGGRKFNPFGIHTKYYRIEEETHNGSI